MDYIKEIKKRRSVRTFQTREIARQDLSALLKYIENNDNLKGPQSSDVHLTYVPVSSSSVAKEVKVGTYGFIKNAKGYIAGTCNNDKQSLVDLGYVMEKMILFLTGLNLGTCWLGGTFDRNAILKGISMPSDYILAAVTPLGYIAEKQRVFEQIARKVTRADNKKSWSELFFDHDFTTPLKHSSAGKWAVPLEMVRLGPSASNKQPWRVVIQGNVAHVYLLESPGYNRSMGYEIQQLDMGIALCHLELSACEMGLDGSWESVEPALRKPYKNLQYVVSLVLE